LSAQRFRGKMDTVRSRLLAIAVVAYACASASPQPGAPAPATAPSPGGAAVAPLPAPAATRPCCIPQGAEDPADRGYEDCVAAGGRRWGTDGCGVRPDGSAIAPPPQTE
jgi:hypothetical protein